MNTVAGVAVAKALTAKGSDELLKVLDLDNSSRVCTTAQQDSPEGARTEVELILHHKIVSMVKKNSIPASLIINIDQTSLKYAPFSS